MHTLFKLSTAQSAELIMATTAGADGLNEFWSLLGRELGFKWTTVEQLTPVMADAGPTAFQFIAEVEAPLEAHQSDPDAKIYLERVHGVVDGRPYVFYADDMQRAYCAGRDRGYAMREAEKVAADRDRESFTPIELLGWRNFAETCAVDVQVDRETGKWRYSPTGRNSDGPTYQDKIARWKRIAGLALSFVQDWDACSDADREEWRPSWGNSLNRLRDALNEGETPAERAAWEAVKDDRTRPEHYQRPGPGKVIENLKAVIHALQERERGGVALLVEAAKLFRSYEASHRAKMERWSLIRTVEAEASCDDARRKAGRNREIAQKIEAFLGARADETINEIGTREPDGPETTMVRDPEQPEQPPVDARMKVRAGLGYYDIFGNRDAVVSRVEGEKVFYWWATHGEAELRETSMANFRHWFTRKPEADLKPAEIVEIDGTITHWQSPEGAMKFTIASGPIVDIGEVYVGTRRFVPATYTAEQRDAAIIAWDRERSAFGLTMKRAKELMVDTVAGALGLTLA